MTHVCQELLFEITSLQTFVFHLSPILFFYSTIFISFRKSSSSQTESIGDLIDSKLFDAEIIYPKEVKVWTSSIIIC